MSLSINLNSSALNAHNNLAATNSTLGKSIGRLSSGYKINNASDDPAGLVISENLRAQMGGLTQAVSNSQDATNMVKTAEGALTEVNTLLKSMRTLAVHAANAGANSSASIAADQSQIASAITSLNNISANTAFGNLKLLDGSGSVNVTNLAPTTVASISAASSGSAFAPAGVAGNITVNVTTAAAAASKTLTETGGYASAAATVNNAGTVTINGVGIAVDAADTVQNVIDKINLASSQTGVTASFSGGNLKLDQQSMGSDKLIAYSESADIFNDGAASVSSGIDAVATVTINGAASTFTSGKGKVLENAAGDKISLVTGAVANLGTVGYAAGAGLTFQIGANAGETATVSIGSTAANKLGLNNGTSTFASVADIDVTVNASDSIKVLDAAITQVSTQRASLGAFQKNVLESNMNSLNVTNENVAASESAIRDTDMAAEMTNFTRLNILAQAGIAMLTQANQQPQQMLSLLK